jgi:branched-subunit amino acid aminotransferase/4-amino-4-deoxychorismate lyase
VYDVVNADEAMITVTSKCLVPATRINGTPIGDGKPGPIVTRLQNAWSEHFGMDFVSEALAHLKPDTAPVAASV